MSKEKITTKFGNTSVTQTVDGFLFEVKPDLTASKIEIPPEVTFKDVEDKTVLGDPNNLHVTVGQLRGNL